MKDIWIYATCDEYEPCYIHIWDDSENLTEEEKNKGFICSSGFEAYDVTLFDGNLVATVFHEYDEMEVHLYTCEWDEINEDHIIEQHLPDIFYGDWVFASYNHIKRVEGRW